MAAMIRTTEELISRVDKDLIWRRKELSELKGLVQETQGQIRCRVIIRSAVALLYAHWEGFVKTSSSNYLEFVSSHRLPYAKLAPNFVALALKAKFNELAASEKISGANLLADFFCTSLNKQSNVPYRGTVDTKSNLSSKVLQDILSALGIPQANFSKKMNFIDTDLVNRRNHIAHGEDLGLSTAAYMELHEAVMSLLETYRNDVENAAVLKSFQRVPA
jgi:hypothetical protein